MTACCCTYSISRWTEWAPERWGRFFEEGRNTKVRGHFSSECHVVCALRGIMRFRVFWSKLCLFGICVPSVPEVICFLEGFVQKEEEKKLRGRIGFVCSIACSKVRKVQQTYFATCVSLERWKTCQKVSLKELCALMGRSTGRRRRSDGT